MVRELVLYWWAGPVLVTMLSSPVIYNPNYPRSKQLLVHTKLDIFALEPVFLVEQDTYVQAMLLVVLILMYFY